MDIVILGSKTMLGRAFHKAGRAASDVEPIPLDVTGMAPHDILRVADQIPDASVVVNCIGDINPRPVDASSHDIFVTENLQAVQNIARACSKRRTRLVHFSSVYIFDGFKAHPYTERDTANPPNLFGTIKLAADKQVRATGGVYLLIRLPLLYGEGEPNWVDETAREIRDNALAPTSSSILFCPTWSKSVAEATLHVLRQGRTGVMNFSAAGTCTPFEASQAMASILNPSANIMASSEEARPSEAILSHYGILDCSLYANWTETSPPLWHEELKTYFATAT